MHCSNIRGCNECDLTSACDNCEDKRIYRKDRDNSYLLVKSPDSPLMVYERAALFLEQFEQNRKRNHNIKKYDSDFIPEEGDHSMWSAKCSRYNYNLPRSISYTSPQNEKCHRPSVESTVCCARQDQFHSFKSSHDRKSFCLTPDTPKESDSQNQIVEAAAVSSKELSGEIKKADIEISIIVLISMFWVMILSTVCDRIHAVLTYTQQKLAIYIMKCWTRWNMTNLFKNKKCSKVTLFLFTPIIAGIGAFYSCVWVAYVLSKTLRRPVPLRYVKKVNLKNLFE